MSFPVFKDFDKAPADIINDDFDSKYTLKIKSTGPANTTVTTNTTYDAKTNNLVPKLTLKWAHASGFTLEKLESSADGKLSVETSLTGAAPGLKLEFKGNDSDKAELAFTYKSPAATVAGDVDVANLGAANFSVFGGQGAFGAGASVNVKLAKSAVQSTNVGVGLSYTAPQVFVAARADKNFANYSALFTYAGVKDVTLAGKVTYDGKDANATVATVYQFCPVATLKVKAGTNGVFAASVKQSFDKKFTVVGSAEVPSSLNGVKFGVNATLG